MILQLSTDIIFKEAFVSQHVSFFKRVLERFFEFFRMEGYPGMVTPFKWEDRIDHVDTGVYLSAGKVTWATEGWKVNCEFIEREPYYIPGYAYVHEMLIEHPANHIYFKLVFKFGDEVTTELTAEVNMPQELESRFITYMEEK
jgi:hypothetical protein